MYTHIPKPYEQFTIRALRQPEDGRSICICIIFADNNRRTTMCIKR